MDPRHFALRMKLSDHEAGFNEAAFDALMDKVQHVYLVLSDIRKNHQKRLLELHIGIERRQALEFFDVAEHYTDDASLISPDMGMERLVEEVLFQRLAHKGAHGLIIVVGTFNFGILRSQKVL